MAISRLQQNFGHLFFANREIRDALYARGPNFPFLQNMVAKRGLTNRSNVHTPMLKSPLKHSPTEFQSIQQCWMQLDIVS